MVHDGRLWFGCAWTTTQHVVGGQLNVYASTGRLVNHYSQNCWPLVRQAVKHSFLVPYILFRAIERSEGAPQVLLTVVYIMYLQKNFLNPACERIVQYSRHDWEC